MNIAVVDDEEAIREQLGGFIKKRNSDFDISGFATGEGLQFPEKLFIQSYDIGIILGNALDNAMEACRKLKTKEAGEEAFIRISSFQKRELFFLKVENSFDGRVARRPRNEFPVTDKADRENHGIGLINSNFPH